MKRSVAFGTICLVTCDIFKLVYGFCGVRTTRTSGLCALYTTLPTDFAFEDVS